MILFLVPVLCAVAGLILYVALRATGAFGVFAGTDGRATTAATRRASTPPSTLGERIRGIPPGWLVAVIALAALWIVGWLVVLAIGLNLLT